MKFAKVEIELFQVNYRQLSDMSYKVSTRIKNVQCDDLRKTHKTDTVQRVIDRHFTVDPNEYMLVASLDFKPNDQTYSMARQQCNKFIKSSIISSFLFFLFSNCTIRES